MANELSVITGKGWINLSHEQTNILDDAQHMELELDQAGNHEGSIFIIQGQLGSGKTVLGMEIGRIVSSRRQLMSKAHGKTVHLSFCAPGLRAGQLLHMMRDKTYKIESQRNIMKTV